MLFISCFLVFSSYNSFVIYVSYELSLLPIIYVILKAGVYPDRSSASLYLLAFTSLFALPFSYLLFHLYSSYGSLRIAYYTSMHPTRVLFSLLIFLTFSVKLPIYGLHHWLPLAHVEAPTFGSMILAGVLLKLGGVGLIRFSSLIDLLSLKSIVLAYSLFFLSFVTLLCIAQSDFKRLVAYSSVSHMMLIPILLIINTVSRFKVMILVIFFHAISSPLLFSIVGAFYAMHSSRMLAFVRGLLTISPLFSFIVLLSFILTMSVPPTPSFVAEVLFITFSLASLPLSSLFILLFVFLSLVYNLH